MFCKHCGNTVAEDAKFCSGCGNPLAGNTDASVNAQSVRLCPKCGDRISKYAQICRNCGLDLTKADYSATNRHCPRCKGGNIKYETVSEKQPIGCLTVILYILLAVTVLGILIVIPLLLCSKSKTVTYAVCQDCGYRWKVC